MCDVGLGSSEGIACPLTDTPKYMPLLLLEKILDDELIGDRCISINFLMTERLRGTLKKCVNSQAVYPLSEQHGLEAQERR